MSISDETVDELIWKHSLAAPPASIIGWILQAAFVVLLFAASFQVRATLSQAFAIRDEAALGRAQTLDEAERERYEEERISASVPYLTELDGANRAKTPTPPSSRRQALEARHKQDANAIANILLFCAFALAVEFLLLAAKPVSSIVVLMVMLIGTAAAAMSAWLELANYTAVNVPMIAFNGAILLMLLLSFVVLAQYSRLVRDLFPERTGIIARVHWVPLAYMIVLTTTIYAKVSTTRALVLENTPDSICSSLLLSLAICSGVTFIPFLFVANKSLLDEKYSLARAMVTTLVAGIGILAFSFIYATIMGPNEEQTGMEAVVSALRHYSWWGTLVTTVVLPAIAEELFFRQFAYGILRPGLGQVASVGITSLMFMLGHAGAVSLLPAFFVVGIILGTARTVSGTVWVPMALHFANNLVAFGTALPLS